MIKKQLNKHLISSWYPVKTKVPMSSNESPLLLASYHYSPAPDGSTYPVIQLKITYKNKVAKPLVLIDSGASISLFRADIVESLGIKIRTGKIIYLRGVGGYTKGYIHTLNIDLAGKEFKAPIVFSHEYLSSY